MGQHLACGHMSSLWYRHHCCIAEECHEAQGSIKVTLKNPQNTLDKIVQFLILP